MKPEKFCSQQNFYNPHKNEAQKNCAGNFFVPLRIFELRSNEKNFAAQKIKKNF